MRGFVCLFVAGLLQAEATTFQVSNNWYSSTDCSENVPDNQMIMKLSPCVSGACTNDVVLSNSICCVSSLPKPGPHQISMASYSNNDCTGTPTSIVNWVRDRCVPMASGGVLLTADGDNITYHGYSDSDCQNLVNTRGWLAGNCTSGVKVTNGTAFGHDNPCSGSTRPRAWQPLGAADAVPPECVLLSSTSADLAACQAKCASLEAACNAVTFKAERLKCHLLECSAHPAAPSVEADRFDFIAYI
eukprot:TRINITY_DN20159_c0_g1_i1.p1 TRINITY_DN20159_c0_g1~~TRINITY_DN20159_c0_g1_i1.p1  ORF type:complete len:245 (-),score=47.01 TRINITY_DN20159_c0_g1_i1:302-1036(-)